KFGGKMVGKTITIGNQRFYIGSAQDWYDMWGKLVTDQTAYDVQTHFIKALEQVAPDDRISSLAHHQQYHLLRSQ
ncbi:unnamed protein product, partial [marine sediment metagenome]